MRGFAKFAWSGGLLLCLLHGASQAQLLKEQFAYSTGNLVGNGTPAWSETGTNTASPLQVQATSLDYAGLAGEAGGSVKVASGSNYEDAGKDLTFSLNDGETIYASLLLKVNTTQSAEQYIAHFGSSGGSATDFRGRLFVKRGSGGGFQLGIAFRDTTGAPVYAATEYANGTTVFVVVGYQAVSGSNNDLAKLWINPALGQTVAPAATVTAITADTEITTFGRFGLRQPSGTGLDVDVDELRIDKSWALVTAASMSGSTGPDPAIVVPGSVNFAGTMTASDDRAVTVTNTGATQNLALTSATLSGPGAARFAVLNGAVQNIAPAAKGFVNVRFTPSALGVTTATLHISSNATGSPLSDVALTGRGLPLLPYYEPFDYAPGDVVERSRRVLDLIPFTGGQHATVLDSASDSTKSLAYAGLETPRGRRLEIHGANPGDDLFLQFDNHIAAGSVYAAFLLKMIAAPALATTQTVTLAGFNKVQGATNYTQGNLRLVAGTAANTYRLAVSQGRYLTADIAVSQNLNVGATYLLVLKYTIVAGANNDEITLLINPNPASGLEGAGALQTLHYVHSGTSGQGDYDLDANYLNGVRLLQDGFADAWTAELDELRINTQYLQLFGPAPNAVMHWESFE
jgi:hypothetical protein